MGGLPDVKSLTVNTYLAELAADSLFPSAGAAAGLTAAQAAALFAMVCRVNLRKLKEIRGESTGAPEAGAAAAGGKKGKEEAGAAWIFWQKMLELAEDYQKRCLELVQADGAAYREVVDGDPQGPAHALEVPLAIARHARETAELIRQALPESYAPVRADAETALHLAEGSKKAALVVARHNLALLSGEAEREKYLNQIELLDA